jgi:hypothetical protein
VSVALVHFPILARDGSEVTTSITNLDIHDIARSAFTYGVHHYFIVHPVHAQRELAERVIAHWTTGSGALRIPDRRPPMETVRVVSSLEIAKDHLASVPAVGDSQLPEVWVTSALDGPTSVSHEQARQKLAEDGPPVLLVLGTGWGLSPRIMDTADLRLAPISSPRADGYNHLSVRAAAAIFFDRLLRQPTTLRRPKTG